MGLLQTAKNAVARLGSSAANKVARAFDAGQGGRRLAAIPNTTTAINTLIRTYGRSVTARSRYLCTNNPYATAAKEVFVSALVGYGIKPSTLGESKEDKRKVQELWLDWTREADFDNVLDFYGLQGLAAAELFEAGEVFVILGNRPRNLTVPLTLRLMQSEMLPTNMSWAQGMTRGNYIDMGIEFNPQGERVAYHFLTRHPGDYGSNPQAPVRGDTIRVPAEKVLHLYKPIRAGQIRGVPHTLASLVTLAMLDLYNDAELERKRVAALFTAFITTNPQEGSTPEHPLGRATQDPTDGNAPSIQMRPGASVDLRPGEDVTFAEPAEVGNSYEPFQYRQLLAAAAGMGVPYMSMTGDLRQANYGSIRAGLVEFRRRIGADQQNVMIHQFTRPIWILFHDMAAIAKLLPWSPSKYLANRLQHIRARFIPPKWDWVDPKKDIEAEVLAIDNLLKSRDDSIEEQGYDPEETDDRIMASQEREADLGLERTGAAAPAPDPTPPTDGEDPTDPPQDPQDPPAPAPRKKKDKQDA